MQPVFTDIHAAAPQAVRSILLITLSNVGDAVMTTPVMAALHHKYPQAFMDIVTDARADGTCRKVCDHDAIGHRIAGIGQGSEWILKPETPWLIRLTNNSGATIDWSYEFSWYEISYDENTRVSI